MSNSLAIAAATTGLRWILRQGLAGPEPSPVAGASITTLRPDKIADLLKGDDPSTGLNVFCYQITPNHAWNLHDLPTRGADGVLVRRPVAAVDLHYLITGYGNDATLDDQRLLARAVLALSVTPVLTRAVLEEARILYRDDDGMGFLDDNDLGTQPELVKFASATLSLEELAKLWGIFGTAYLPSLTYAASVVLLEAQVSPLTSLPVRTRTIGVRASGPPRLVSATPADAAVPLTLGGTVRLTGGGLRGEITRVELADVELTPTRLTGEEIDVVLTAAVPAGLHLVRVVHRSPATGGAPSRVVAASEPRPLLVRPSISLDPPAGANTVVRVSPPIQPGQAAMVTFSRIADGEPASVARVFPSAAPGTPARETLSAASPAEAGTWLVRVEVAGAESVPQLVGETYGAPTVTT